MRISRAITKAAALVAAIVLLTGVAHATLAGVITEVTKRDITISGAVYPFDDDVEIQDMTGHPITRPELRPGVSVELEFDDEGRLSLIRAAVVR